MSIGHIHVPIMLIRIHLRALMTSHLSRGLVRLDIRPLRTNMGIHIRTRTRGRTHNPTRRISNIHTPHARRQRLPERGAQSSGNYGKNGTGRRKRLGNLAIVQSGAGPHPVPTPALRSQMVDGARVGSPRVVLVLRDRTVEGMTVRSIPVDKAVKVIGMRQIRGGKSIGLIGLPSRRTSTLVHHRGRDSRKHLPCIPSYGRRYSLPTTANI
jgi:hypothetical protein